MTVQAILPIWKTVRSRFMKSIETITEEELSLKLHSESIGFIIRHTAEVEFMFAEWFFGVKMPADLDVLTGRGRAGEHPAFADLDNLMKWLKQSDETLVLAMEQLQEHAWNISVQSPIGPSTPLESVGRILYHTGLHAGQISLIRKQ